MAPAFTPRKTASKDADSSQGSPYLSPVSNITTIARGSSNVPGELFHDCKLHDVTTSHPECDDNTVTMPSLDAKDNCSQVKENGVPVLADATTRVMQPTGDEGQLISGQNGA